jgi:hypothetical protein
LNLDVDLSFPSEKKMTNPGRYLLRMVIFVLLISGLGYVLWAPLKLAFLGNVVINSVILSALFIGIVFTLRQTLRLMPEHRWMRETQRRGMYPSGSKITPSLLATVAVMMADEDRPASLSAQNLRSILDGVAGRLDESREISRYMIGLLVFLGLLGTFWGLLITVQSVGNVVGGINTSTSDIDSMLDTLKEGLNAPLSGMATAFSSSLFGLGGSLILGFLDLQLGQASGRFLVDLEDWLSKSLNFETSDDSLFADNTASAGLAAATVAGRRGRSDQVTEDIASLDTSIRNLTRELKADRKQLNDTISMELRALSRALAIKEKKKKKG